uniref:uncharacterized protein isoform X2 n=1 Tax=Semicossyphus pulcher TaxID=241346 RepID=UPI0037E7F14C
MTSPFITYLFLTGLIGFHCQITTVTKVSVKAGGSISVPCLYGPSYKTHVKYLCRGKPWHSCQYAVKTDKPDKSGKFSISDDTEQRIFTVTFNNVTDNMSDTYWCAVDLWISDTRKKFQLSVTSDMPSLYVDRQEMTVFERGIVTISCHYKYSKVKDWCRLGSTCVTEQNGSKDGTMVTVNDSVPNVFTVTMSGLRTDSSGWYWCTNGTLQIPVHITVHELPSTTITTAKTTMNINTANFTGTSPTTTQLSFTLESGEQITSWPTNSTTSNASKESPQNNKQNSMKMTVPITVLVLLLFIVFAAFFGLRMKRRKRTQPEVPKSPESPQTGSDPDVLYTTVSHKQRVASQQKNHIPEASVIYSTIVKKDNVQQMTEPADGSVIYSTVQK